MDVSFNQHPLGLLLQMEKEIGQEGLNWSPG